VDCREDGGGRRNNETHLVHKNDFICLPIGCIHRVPIRARSISKWSKGYEGTRIFRPRFSHTGLEELGLEWLEIGGVRLKRSGDMARGNRTPEPGEWELICPLIKLGKKSTHLGGAA
jgi:hypothetical protein